MRLVRQQWANDCGLAVAAMLAGVSYREADRADPKMNWDRGMSVEELRECLRALGLETRVSMSRRGEPFGERGGDGWQGPVAVIIRRPGDGWGHWVACHRGKVYDPEMRSPQSIADYGERSRWLVIRQILPLA